MKTTIKMVITGVLIALLFTACSDLMGPNEITDGKGNVTIIFDAEAGRTIRPNNITALSAFERIELEFIKGSGADAPIKIVNVAKGTTSYTTTLEEGIWSINARGFMKIEDREYEAAEGSAVVTISSTPQNVPIVLQTGILGDKPGVFSYTIGFPTNVTEAVLEINPLPNRHGYGTVAVGKTIDLTQGKTGSFDLLAGYYLLTLTAKTGGTMAIWNELVHIYSGQETTASHTFAAGDFSGTVTLSGFVRGGEFEGNHITGAVVTAYGDENYTSRIASVNVSGFTEMSVPPFEYRSSWSMTVPGSLVGKDVYFSVEETLSSPGGTRTIVWDEGYPVKVLAGVTPEINLGASYVWYKWADSYVDSDVNYTVSADGTITVSTQAVVNEWDIWRQNVGFSFPAENGIRYAYEFEAWTQSGERQLGVQYINNPKYEEYESVLLTIDANRQTFTVVSDIRFDADLLRRLEFMVGHTEPGTLSIKIKSIKPATEYIPPSVGDSPRLTATATTGGIRLKADLRGLPVGLSGLMFFEERVTDASFTTNWIWDTEDNPPPEFYEFLFPYVQADKEYTFRVEYQGAGIVLGAPRATATATDGRGELAFANALELAVVKEGNSVKFNKDPVLSSFDDTNVEDARYMLQVASGTSWGDPLVEWRYAIEMGTPQESVDLIEVLDELPDWTDIPSFLGKTCFADMYYEFDYDANDIFSPDQSGTFRIAGIGSTPFVYPNVLPEIFTAEQHTEGVKLSIDLNRIPVGTNSVRIYLADNSSAEFWLGDFEWKENDWGEGRFYGQDTVEIIYPFVQAGKTYTFMAEYTGSGALGEATVTPTAGLGALNITNAANIGLSYSSGTKTLTLTEVPIVSLPAIGNNSNVTSTLWEWQYYKGYNWDDAEWKGLIQYDEPKTSVVLDDTFDPLLGSVLSNTYAFVNVLYRVEYGEFSFTTSAFATSPSFRFPYFDPVAEVEYVDTGIRTAFDTNRDLYLRYEGYVWPGNDLYASVDYFGNSYISSCTWFIDGVKQEGLTNEDVSLPTIGLSPGMHYGLVVVTIDGAAFAKEFAFRVMD